MDNFNYYKEELKEAYKNGDLIFYIENTLNFRIMPNTSEMIGWLLRENTESILSSEEREYLSSVINPFRDRVSYVQREENSYYENDLFIVIKDENRNCYMKFVLPIFNGKFINMALNKEYTLKELEL